MLLIRHWELPGLLKSNKESPDGERSTWFGPGKSQNLRGAVEKSWQAFFVPGAPQRHLRQLELVRTPTL